MSGFAGDPSPSPSPSKQAFLQWYGEASLGGTPTPAEDAAFQAGVEWVLNTALKGKRGGGDLVGRMIVQHRILFPVELEREGIAAAGVHWPCLVLDDGTLVFPPFAPKVTGNHFLGYRPHAPEGERKITFAIQALSLGTPGIPLQASAPTPQDPPDNTTAEEAK